MTLTSGSRLGPYEITAAIGAGGMGEVYKARDTRLGRTVAIKVLPAGAARDPERRRRFEQEARVVAALIHPHICTLFDVGREGETDYLVMEFVEGQALAERLKKGPLPLEQALEYATQIAQALVAAHKEGIIHRDLKPGNVMVTRSGAKLLDFGLAKLELGGWMAEGTGSAIPTREADTEKGTILGTLAYMSPEQLEGGKVDARSDLFSFGALVYEMLTGKRPFEAASRASVITAIMSATPAPLSTLVPLTPPALDRLVTKCLAKDPDRRWQSAADLADELAWISTGSGSLPSMGVPASAPVRARRLWLWVAAAATLVLAAGAGTLWWSLRERAAVPPAEARHTQVTFGGDIVRAALAPDGRALAYATGEEGIDVRLKVRDVTGDRAAEVWSGKSISSLGWTADGTQLRLLGRTQDAGAGSWMLVSRFGGASRRLGEAIPSVISAFSPDGSQLCWRSGHEFVFPGTGSPPARVVVTDQRSLIGITENGRNDEAAVIGIADTGLAAIWLVKAGDKQARRVYTGKEGETPSSVAWSPTDRALYYQRIRNGVGELTRLELSAAGSTSPEVLLSGLPVVRQCVVSADGSRLFHVRTTTAANLWRLDLAQPVVKPSPLTQGTADLESPHLSPDGKWISVTRGTDLLRLPAGGGEFSPLATGMNGSWSPDGRRFAYASPEGKDARVWVGDADGQRATEVQGAELSANRFVQWFPDGRIGWQIRDVTNYNLRALNSGKEELLLTENPKRIFLFMPRFSPRGDQVAVYINFRMPTKKEPAGLWLLSWPGRVLRLLAPGIWPIGWSADGRSIYGHRMRGREVVKVDAENGRTETVVTFEIGRLDWLPCDMTPDRRAMVCSVQDQRTDAWIVDNFDPHVKAKR